MSFWWDGTYLLADFDPAYGFTWRTTRMADGTGTLIVHARTEGGLVSGVRVPVTVGNGLSAPAPPAVEPFVVRTGTAPAPGRRFRMAAVGDGVDGSPREAQVAGQIASWSPNLLAYLGDVYQHGSPFEFDNWYSRPDGYGQFRAITNPVVGNHEYQTPGAAGYFEYWGGVPHYYSYDVAGWHVVALDTNSRFGQLRPGTAQYEWLAADLGANRSRCTMVYMHHPRYSVAAHEGRAQLGRIWSLLAARRVTLAVAGHSHAYERWTPLDGAGVPGHRAESPSSSPGPAGARSSRPRSPTGAWSRPCRSVAPCDWISARTTRSSSTSTPPGPCSTPGRSAARAPETRCRRRCHAAWSRSRPPRPPRTCPGRPRATSTQPSAGTRYGATGPSSRRCRPPAPTFDRHGAGPREDVLLDGVGLRHVRQPLGAVARLRRRRSPPR